jgi:hypothetical protein
MLPEVSEGLVLTWWGGVDLAMVCHLCQLQGQAKDDDGIGMIYTVVSL